MAHLPESPNLIHHGPPGVYVKTPDEDRADLQPWQANCREYNADPAGYLACRKEEAEAAVAAERQRGDRRDTEQ